MHNLSNYWINVNRIKNFILDDPLLDWLEFYGKENGFEYDKNIKDSFKDFITQKSEILKQKIFERITEKDIVQIDKQLPIRRRIALTLKYIVEGKNTILNPELFNNKNNFYGNCDIIVRSDKINKLFKNNIFQYGNENIGCSLHKNFHYVILNIYCVKIKLSKNYNILNTKKNVIFKSTNILLNNSLSDIQGYKPESIFIIGDKYEIQNKILCNENFIANINNEDEKKIYPKIKLSLKWLKELYLYGEDWSVYPPSRNELYPNMCNIENDFPWHNTKKEIALKLNEITLLWNCGIKQRNSFHKEGIYQWKDVNTNHLTFNQDKKNIISKMIDINYYSDNIIVYPRKIKKKQNIEIMNKKSLQFIVDFETINLEDEDNYFKGIFMIGCLVVFENNESEFKQFTAKKLNDEEEENIVREWIEYMEIFEQKFNTSNCKIFHWGKAEQFIYRQVNNKLKFKDLNFIDLLDVFKTEPIIIKDCFSYGLKDVVKSLHKYGIIKEIWEEEMNGKEAMIKAWENYNNKDKSNVMENIKKYNYYDCKVIDNILIFLREMI
jgi:hypothetical protein